jgi:hypothetical protein
MDGFRRSRLILSKKAAQAIHARHLDIFCRLLALHNELPFLPELGIAHPLRIVQESSVLKT